MSRNVGLTRREWLRGVAAGIIAGPCTGLAAVEKHARFVEPKRVPYRGSDDNLLDEIERGAFDFFWTEAGSSGQVKDRALVNGRDTHTMASIAATGFGLTGLCIGHERRYRNGDEIKERVRQTLRFVWEKLPQEHGFYYHFVDIESGQRQWMSEVSSIDTSILMCGVLTARQHFRDAEIQDLATKIYERVDWHWMLDGARTMSRGWYPESGFLPVRWSHYCELMMIYLLGLGSPTYPITSSTWGSWKRPGISYEGYEYISGKDPLFTHQYSQAWFDFRGKQDAYTNYFQNSITATMAIVSFVFRCDGSFRITASACGASPRPIRCGDIEDGEDHLGSENQMVRWFRVRPEGRWSFCFRSAWTFCGPYASDMVAPGGT